MAKKPFVLLVLSAALLLTLHAAPAQPPSTAALQQQLRACELALAEAEQTCGKHSEAYAQALERQADALWDLERYDDAIEAARRAAELCETLYGARTPEHADARYGLALKYALTHRYAEYREAMYTAMRLKEALISEKEEQYLARLFDIAKNYGMADFPADAERVARRALDYVASVSGPTRPVYASALELVAGYLFDNEHFDEALDCIRQAAGIRQAFKQENLQAYILTMMKLANYASKLGDYAHQVGSLEACLEEIAGTPLSDTSLHSAVLTSLAGVYASLGNTHQYGVYTKQALLITEKLQGFTFPEYVWRDVENDIRGGYENIETEADYKALLKEQKAFLRELKAQGRGRTSDYADGLFSLALDYAKLKDFKKALETVRESEAIIREYAGEQTLDYANALYAQAVYHSNLEQFDAAVGLLLRTAEIRKSILGDEHPDYITVLQNLAVSTSRLGDPRVREFTLAASEKTSQLLRDVFAYLTTAERNFYWEKNSGWHLHSLPSIALKNPGARLNGALYDGVLLSKGLLLNTELELTRLLQQSGSEEVLHLYQRLYVLRNRLKNRSGLSAGLRDSLGKSVRDIEQALIRSSQKYGDYTRRLQIRWQQVADALPDGAIAIEFITAPVAKDSLCYAALTLKKGYDEPRLTRLFRQEELREVVQNHDVYASDILTKLLWEPLQAECAGVSDIYFSPTADLHMIAIESLPGREQHLGGTSRIYRLSSTRELLAEPSGEGRDAVLYGGLVYRMSIGEMALDQERHPVARQRDFAFNPFVDSLGRGVSRRIPELPATKTEVEEIAALMETAGREELTARMFRENEGTEAAFKSLSGRNTRIIHLATHGFYVPPVQKDVSDGGTLEDDALARCGLYLAGADNKFRGADIPEGVDDGILTAAEVALLDLRGLDMVVLSACDTAKGDMDGDSVFGLQRGFKKAGANSIIMSLWSVDDAATRLLMTEFYRGWTGGLSKYEALERAKARVRSDERYGDSRYWAAFILLDGTEKN